MVFVFYHRLAFDAFKSVGYLRRRLRRGELRRAVVISVKQTLAAYLQLLRGLLRVPSDLICDCHEWNFARNPALISPRNTRAASAFALRLRLAVARLPRGSKFYAENRKISRLNVVAEIFQKIYA